MGGLRVNAKGEPVGFHLDTLKEGNVFLQARWLKCFERFCSVGFLAKGFFVRVFLLLKPPRWILCSCK